MIERRDFSGRLYIEIDSDCRNFGQYTSRMESEANAKLIQKLNGLEQQYWDYQIDGTTIVLHADTFAGVSIHIEDNSNDTLLRSVAQKIDIHQITELRALRAPITRRPQSANR